MAIDKSINYEMQGNVKNYLGNQKMVKAPLHWRSGPKHPKTELAYITKAEKDLLIKKDLHKSLKGGVNRGPSGIISLNGWGSSDPAQNRAGSSISAGMDKSASDAGWGGASAAKHGSKTAAAAAMSPADLSLLAGQKGSSTVMPASHYGRKYKAPGEGFGIRSLFSGAMGAVGGIPGKLMALLSKFNPQKLRGWNEEEDRYNTQGEWQDARDARINQKSIDRILNRSDKFPITANTQQRLGELGYAGEMPSIGSTASLRKGTELGLHTGAIPKANDFITRKNQNIKPEYGVEYDVNMEPYRLPPVHDFQNVNFNNNLNTNNLNATGIDPTGAEYLAGKGINVDFLKHGGRAGYRFGEEVEQETDFIEGPQGGEEFQETVVEGQDQPSREQLEALAMEIFQLPLEELDEQQLLVVYQEAMQGQPMEEAVQEEDVQFAANGGLASLL